MDYTALQKVSESRKSTNLMTIGKYDKEGHFSLKPGKPRLSKALTICRALPKATEGVKTLNTMLDPSLVIERTQKIETAKAQYFKNFEEMNISRSYDKLFELLWYTRLPCFDVKGITSKQKDESSMIKRCYWRGKMVDCGQIFVARPTDRGMCCAFNFDNAEKVFKDSTYTDTLTNHQKKDKSLRFDDTSKR